MYLNKINAIHIINESDLNISNTVYSRITSTVNSIPAYWFEPKNIRFNNNLYLILDNQFDKILNYFFIEGFSIIDPKTIFYQRDDKSASSIKIKYDDLTFTDTASPNRFSFLPYLQKKISY